MSCHCSLLPSGLLRPERENPIPEQGVATQDSLIESKGPTLRAPLHMFCTLLGVPSWVRFCQQEFWKFPWPAWAVGSYSSGPPAGGTTQILVDKTSPMTGRLRVYKIQPKNGTDVVAFLGGMGIHFLVKMSFWFKFIYRI